jgi:hypothetical protein
MRITAPNTSYSGTGPGGVVFTDGVAELDPAKPEHRAALQYFRDLGYGVDGDPTEPEGVPVQADSREVGGEHTVGTSLRDAAVDPHSEDFLPPTNAGEADPHGPLVVAPGVHASETGPIHPGDVHVDDPKAQEAQETALAEAVFVKGEDVTGATRAAAGAGEVHRPAQSDTKAHWVDYALHADASLSRQDAESMTKADLIETYGQEG